MRANEIILAEDCLLLSEGVTWKDVKVAIVTGLVALSAYGLDSVGVDDISQMSPAEVKNELQHKVDVKDLAKDVQAVKAKLDTEKQQTKVDTTPAVDEGKLASYTKIIAKQYMRQLGYNVNVFGHLEGKSFLSDRTKSGYKGNGYWNFQIEVENRFGGDERIPVVVGFGDYKVNKIKVDGQLYNITNGPDIRKNPIQ